MPAQAQPQFVVPVAGNQAKAINRGSASLYVGDLSPEVSDSDLFQLFSAVATVHSVHVCRNNVTRESRGYAYVNFHTVEDAERALDALNYREIKGRVCRIMWSDRNPNRRQSGVGNLFVKNLPASVHEKQLEAHFAQLGGNVLTCKVARDRETGKPHGYGFVLFDSHDAAKEALEKLDGSEVDGTKISVEPFKQRAQRQSANQWTNLYVKHFPGDWSDDAIAELFSAYGKITSIKVNRNEEGNALFAFVNLDTHEAAKAAVEKLHGTKLEGCKNPLVVNRHQSRNERQREITRSLQQRRRERAEEMKGRNVYVKNLPEDMDEERIRAHFADFGSIQSMRIVEKEGQRTGVAYILFDTAEGASAAIEKVNGNEVEGKRVYVQLWQPKEARQSQLHRQRQAMRAMQPMMMMQQQMMGRFNPAMMQQQPSEMQMMMMMMQQQMMQQQAQQQRGAGRGRGRGRRNNPNMRVMQNARNMDGQQQMPNYGNMTPQMLAHQQAMAQQQQAMAQQQQPAQGQGQPESVQHDHSQLLDALRNSNEEEQKNILGEHLYPRIEDYLVSREQGDLAGKVTGMLLEGMEVEDLLNLVEDRTALLSKIHEALEVLNSSQ